MRGDTVFLPPKYDAYVCWGFMGATQQLLAYFGFDNLGPLHSCPPPNTTLTQLTKVVINYAQKHPERLNLPAGVIAMVALQDAFPCK